MLAQFVVRWVSYLPLWQRMKRRFVWWNQGLQEQRTSSYGAYAGEHAHNSCMHDLLTMQDDVHPVAICMSSSCSQLDKGGALVCMQQQQQVYIAKIVMVQGSMTL